MLVIMLPISAPEVFISGNAFPISGNGKSILGFVRPCPHPVHQYILSSPFFNVSRIWYISKHQAEWSDCVTLLSPICTEWSPCGRMASRPDQDSASSSPLHPLAVQSLVSWLFLKCSNHVRHRPFPWSGSLFPQMSACLMSFLHVCNCHLIVRPFNFPDTPC